jgi:gliding motility-associated-like protein/uncharacterized repeat protein (TIGR01451 family)
MVGGPIASLAPGASDAVTFTASYIITQGDIDAGMFENQATATGTPPSGSDVSDLSDFEDITLDRPTVVEICNDPSIALIKVGTYEDIDPQTGECISSAGDEIIYAFTVTNTGNVTLSNIDVTDPLVTMVGGPIASLAPGASDAVTFTASYIITQGDIDAGMFENQATATGTPPSGSDVSDLSDFEDITLDRPTVVEICNDPSIALIKVGTFIDGNGNDCADPGESIEYAFTVVNTGNVTLTNVIVTDPLVTVSGGPIVLAPSQSDATSFTAIYIITQDDIDNGEVVNQATAEGMAPDGTVVNDLSDFEDIALDRTTITVLCQEASIALIKAGEFPPIPGGGCPVEGDVIEYIFTVVNTGNLSLENVIVTDPLVAVVGGPISLAVGVTDAISFTATYTITQADVDAGEVINQATAEGTTPGGDTVTDLSDFVDLALDRPTIVDICQTPVIALIKVGTLDGTDPKTGDCIAISQPGDQITYAFTVFNLGTVILTDITVTDPLVTVQGGPITLAPLTSDATSFTATYILTQDDINAGFVENQALVSGFTLLGDEVTDLSDDDSEFEDNPTVTDVCPGPSMSLEKIGVYNDENGDMDCQVGETISYTFNVINTGNVTIYNITMIDLLPGIVLEGGPIVMLEPGETDTDTFTATYTLTEDDLDTNGEIVNQSMVTGQTIDGDDVTDDSDDPNNPTDDDNNGDGEPDDPTVVPLPCVGSVFEIFNGITPNGDGLNDFLLVQGIDEFPNNNVKIFNRWGVQVFETNGYDEGSNVFRGISEGRTTIRQGEELPTGTYFYILTFSGDCPQGRCGWNGYLYINR